EQLPLLTSDILERYYYTQSAEDDKRYSVYRTSGTSSGIRKAVLYSKSDDEHYIGLKTKLFADWLRGHRFRRAIADLGTGHAASTASIVFERLGLEYDAISFETPIEQHIER